MTSSLFSVLDDEISYAAAVDEFLAAPSAASVPVWTSRRADIVASVERAASLYAGVRRPAARMYGVLLKPETLPTGLARLIAPCASTWVDLAEVGTMLDQLAKEDAGRSGAHSLVIAGLYENFTVDLLWPVLRVAAHRPSARLTFLTGRDAASLAWFTAKQYVCRAPDVDEFGLFTSTDRGLAQPGIHLRDQQVMQTADIKSEVLGTRWRRLFLQGNGKDDSLNLGEFTVCGKNEAVSRDPARLAPLCAHASEPVCYKPVDKLISLREVRAAEIVLSSCHGAPFADAAIYDPKFQLMLNAIDGTAQDIVAAITAHESGHAENRAWIEAALGNASSITALNASITTAQPFPAYVRFGMGENDGVAPEQPSLEPDPLLLTTATRVTAYLAGELLTPKNPLRVRLGELATKIENQVSRRAMAMQDRSTMLRDLHNDLQSLDYAIATQFVEDPENDLSNYPAYYASRSRLDPSSVEHVCCQCGRPAERYIQRSLVPTALDTEGIICMRCGDVAYRLPGAPFLLLCADEDVPQGGTFDVRVVVRNGRPGAVRVGLYVASFARAFCTVTPELRKVRVNAEGDGETQFTLTLAPHISPHAYYMTAFAVQDLAVTKACRHFGVFPATAMEA